MQQTMAWRAIGLIALMLLSGCGLARQQAAERQKQQDMQYLRTSKSDCPTFYPRDRVEQADCITRAENNYLRPHIKNGDLLTLQQTQRHLLASQVARGAMSADEADAHQFDPGALSLKLEEGMTMQQVIQRLGYRPNTTTQETCGSSTPNPWSCRTWTFGDSNRRLVVFFHNIEGQWLVDAWL